MENTLQRTLECQVCFSYYNARQQIPKSLPCGHTFCERCVTQVQKGSKISCPTCRRTHSLPNGQVSGLPTNYAVLDMLDSTCEECKEATSLKVCPHCQKNLCDVCRKNHSSLINESVSSIIAELRKEYKRLQSVSSDESEFDQIKKQAENVQRDIDKTYNAYIEKIQQQKKALKEKVRSLASEDNQLYLDWQEDLDAKLASVKRVLTKLGVGQSGDASADNLDKVKEQCSQMMDVLKQVESSTPCTASYSFQGSIDSSGSKISVSGSINTKPPSTAVKPVLPPKSYNIKSPDYSSARFTTGIGRTRQGEEFSVPLGITISPSTGNVIFTEYGNNRVQILNENLQQLLIFGSEGRGDGQFENPFGVAATSDAIFVVDEGNHRIQVMDNNGNFLDKFGTKGKRQGEFEFPKGIAVDSNGLLYVCDSGNYRIQVIRARDGSFVRAIGSKGQFTSYPRFIAVSANEVAVSDLFGNLCIFTTTGRHLKTITANSNRSFTEARGIKYDHSGQLIIADEAGKLLVLGESGKVKTSFPTQGKLKWPKDIAVTSNGDVLVCEMGHDQIKQCDVPLK